MCGARRAALNAVTLTSRERRTILEVVASSSHPMLTNSVLASVPPRLPLRPEPSLIPRALTASQPRVLVVDDEETIRTALARFLRGRGYEVEVAESGIAALVMPIVACKNCSLFNFTS